MTFAAAVFKVSGGPDRQATIAAMSPNPSLPLDGQRILALAARLMFDLFANASEGMLLVDRDARVVWINDQYKRFLPALGFERVEDFVGHPVSDVVHNTQMHRVLQTGKPILIDLLSNKAGTFVVNKGRVSGTVDATVSAGSMANPLKVTGTWSCKEYNAPRYIFPGLPSRS